MVLYWLVESGSVKKSGEGGLEMLMLVFVFGHISLIVVQEYLFLSVTKAKLVSTSPLEVPRDPFNDRFEFLDLETVTIGFLVKF